MSATSKVKVRGYALLLTPLLVGSKVDMMVEVSQPSWTLDWKFFIEDGGQKREGALGP